MLWRMNLTFLQNLSVQELYKKQNKDDVHWIDFQL